jgi:hypothetical protein
LNVGVGVVGALSIAGGGAEAAGLAPAAREEELALCAWASAKATQVPAKAKTAAITAIASADRPGGLLSD